MSKTVVITGASSGIGKATANKFADMGWQVAATMRKPENTEFSNKLIKKFPLDVTSEFSISSAIEDIITEFGRVDLVINNAGYGQVGVFEATDKASIIQQYETNFFGLMDVTREFLPHFRSNEGGMFINISSMGGLAGFPFASVYNSSKWAIEGFSEALYYELKEIGIGVKVIEPGFVHTDFSGRSLSLAAPGELEAYGPSFSKAFNTFNDRNDKTEDDGSSRPEDIAEVIYRAATDGESKLRYPAGKDAEKLLAARQEMGTEAFMEMIYKSRLG